MAGSVGEIFYDAIFLVGWYHVVMRHKGFTLLELAVVTSIMVMLTAVVFANFPKFNRMLTVRREADKLTLALRKAQAYALAVREFNPAYADDPFCENPPVRFPPYGVSFSMADNKKYLIFGDADCNDIYTAGSNEQVEVFTLAREVVIKSLRGYDSFACSLGCAFDQANATYQRPAPSVILSGKTGGTNYSDLDRIEIVLEMPGQNLSRKIILRTTGDVSIE